MNDNHKKSLKEKAAHELGQLLINFVFMAAIFTSFAMYKRILLGELNFNHFQYGYALFEALILAKIVTLGQSLNIGRRYENHRLAYTILLKTFIFSLFVFAFTVGEHLLESLIRGENLMIIWDKLISENWPLIIGKTIVMFFIFIPYISLIEIVRYLTGGDLYELFFNPTKSSKPE